MVTDYQQAREALGVRLRGLRYTAPGGQITSTQLADALDWPVSKVSKLEHGRQTATRADLRAWAEGTGQAEALPELVSHLAGFETRIRSWRRQLASGQQAVQEYWAAETARSRTIRVWEESTVPGLLQTAAYAQAVLTRYAQLHGSAADTEEAVLVRMRRQEWLYEAGHHLRAVVWEPALRALICPPSVLASQLDRLAGAIGMNTVELGVVPLSAALKISPANSFSILDDRVVAVEDWHAELWLDDAESIALYGKTWSTLRESAVYGAEAHHIIASARRALGAG
ncbi:helix-turn-helix transcriptional regulator [Streptomyces sp. NPDC046465]|uniref:helix-turn-helix domain-containing protein n=1 Tax=Streptomyces sp. NPDC046465 TaxID=3155810 RepID=UPI0033DD7067